MTSQNKILADLHSLSAKVLQYEDKALQAQALKLIPLDRITLQTQRHLRQIQEEIKKKELKAEDETHVNEIFVLHLMRWFKEEFFTWVDRLSCEKCAGPTEASNRLHVDPATRERIEFHHCSACSHDTPFHRYNSIPSLLQTRRGRCGEWANCFSFLCRALSYETRTVHDATDHAWTEIYSPTQKRWIHCDPCEISMDAPLLYERGWNKKLTYILAASCHEVQDVTWRYTADYRGTMQRRTLVAESELVQTILAINNTRQASVSPARRHFLMRRQIEELVQFLTPPSVPEGEQLGGRISGSLAWRLDRGETTSGGESRKFVFELRDEDFVDKTFTLEYSPVADAYYKNRASSPFINQWCGGVYESENVFRKEERDWKMVYLCRTEQSATGHIRWRLDLTAVTSPVTSVEVWVHNSLYEDGTVTWRLSSEKQAEAKVFTRTTKDSSERLNSLQFPACTSLLIECKLEEGRGSLAWQHAQIFRQSLSSKNAECPFRIVVKL